MAFLDNSGDILLDAVLTVAGRKQLANGTFNISKFALGDDEINYGLYDKTNPSGSAYYDLSILKLPVQSALTKDDISQKSRIIRSLSANNLMYLPELKLDQNSAPAGVMGFASGRSAYAIVANDATYNAITGGGTSSPGTESLPQGFLDGRSAALSTVRRIRTPLGIDNASGTGLGQDQTLDSISPQLEETQYNITVDGRFLQLTQPTEGAAVNISVLGATSAAALQGSVVTPSAKSAVFSSADNLKVYTVTTSTHPALFQAGPTDLVQVFKGPSTSQILCTSFVAQKNQDTLFTTYKITDVASYGPTSITMEVIQTNIEYQSAMGFSLTVPVEIIRQA